ncbi:MAG: hypothetical protein JRJ49_10965, partial [Deltaproteobacteria bacterium]|nr:hypothetical protein [Deltaproteobacteria bacterium]
GLTEGKSDGLQRLVSIGVGAAAAGAAGGNSLSGASSAFYGEAYNRQLHQKEIDIVKNKENIKKFAAQAGITEAEAEKILAQVGTSKVDKKWSGIYNKTTIAHYEQAEAFLSELGKETGAFTATQEEKDDFNINKWNLVTNNSFYKKNVKVQTDGIDTIKYFTGIPVGAGEKAIDEVEEIIEIIKDPIKFANDVKDLITADDTTSLIVEGIKEHGKDLVADSVMWNLYGESYEEGKADGRIVTEVGSLIVGGVGAVKAGDKIIKSGAKVIKKGLIKSSDDIGRAVIKHGGDTAKKASTSRFKPTIHSIEQKINRGVRSADELDAIKNPLKVTDVKVDKLGRPSQQMIGEKATVVLNPDNEKIISVWPTSTKKATKLKK